MLVLRRWPRWLATALVASVLVLGAGCGDDGADANGATPTPPAAATEDTGAFPIEVERSDGKTLTFERPLTHIASLSPGATEILFAIGAGDALVAVDNQADYPAEARDFATKVDAFEPNIEAIAALNAEVVIVSDNTGGLVESLDRLSVPVLYVDLDDAVHTLEDVLAQIRLYGQITGRTAEADALADSLGERIDEVDRRVDASREPVLRVYHELDSTFYSVASNTFIGSLYERLGAENIAGDGGGTSYPQLTQEAIVAADPDVIILADEEFGVTVESVMARPGWDAMAAVRDRRIYGIDPDIISRPGPRIVDALEQVARHMYPEAFE